MNSSQQHLLSLHKRFSHVYIETEALEHDDAQRVLALLPNARRIEIESYKELFNRNSQDWRTQKRSEKLILALKRDGFLYRGAAVTPAFGHEHFYYNSLVLNCLFDCDYCYLQGMYPSANIVMFVNSGDFFAAADEKYRETGKMYLCISYDTDLLLFERYLPHCRRWLEFCAARPGLLIELRTKSAAFGVLEESQPRDNFILAWTLSPQEIIDRHEGRTPPLSSRIKALKAALDLGWQVRLCFDPVLAVDGFEECYERFFRLVCAEIPLDRVRDITVGAFRINRDYLARIRASRSRSPLIHFPYKVNDGICTYSSDILEKIEALVRREFSGAIAEEKLFVL